MPDLSDLSPDGSLRPGWKGEVDDCAMAGGWTGGGDALLIGDAAGGVHAFDGKSGARRWARSAVHEGGLLSVAMHPGGAALATSGQDGRALIWNAADGALRATIEVGDRWVENVAWSPDGRLLATSLSRQVRVYRADGTEVWRSDEHRSTVSAIAWSTSGELATACYGRVTFFDGATGVVRQKLEWKGSLVSMALSPDGDVVACGSQDCSVHFWRRSTGQDSMIEGYRMKPSALAFDESGTLLATGGSEAVTVWNFRDGGPEGTRPGVLRLHLRPISVLAFDGERHLASGARDGGVIVWSLERDGTGTAVGVAGASDVVSALYWRPDGRALAALNRRGAVTVWET